MLPVPHVTVRYWNRRMTRRSLSLHWSSSSSSLCTTHSRFRSLSLMSGWVDS